MQHTIITHRYHAMHLLGTSYQQTDRSTILAYRIYYTAAQRCALARL
jgi:hypothetical protein